MPDRWRKSPLPPGWKQTRTLVLTRDGHQCTWTEDGQRCPITTTLEVDHIGDPDDHTLANLRTLCGPHHHRRTGYQAYAASNQALRRRPARRHPGLL